VQQIAASAKQVLHFQTYIFDEDETGIHVAEALMAAAARGVHVYLLIDGYASQDLPVAFRTRLKEAGVHFRFFEPIFFTYKYYFGRRMHHKVLVADGHEALVGGMNVSNRYNDMPGQPAWLDFALHVKGDVCAGLHDVCVRMWERPVFVPKCKPLPAPLRQQPERECKVRIIRNDWVNRKTDIYATYRSMFASAHSFATVMTSYFWPPARLLRHMEVAARKGVKVTVVLTGYADVPFAKYAERYLYRRLFRSNIDVYEYLPNVLHAKIAFRDDEWLTVGSYNVNNISAFASIELNLEVLNADTAAGMRQVVEGIIDADCRQVRREDFELSSHPFRMLLYYLSYRAVHLLFFLFTFYFEQVTAPRKRAEA
jgi:cardiolipin synthase